MIASILREILCHDKTKTTQSASIYYKYKNVAGQGRNPRNRNWEEKEDGRFSKEKKAVREKG